MGLFNWGKRKKGQASAGRAGHGVDELARRLGLPIQALRAVQPTYHRFEIAKRSGGTRVIQAPSADLKHIQRLILRRLLTRLKAHPCVTGFERGHSIATNAQFHAGQAIVVRFDIREFFTSTSEARVRDWLGRIGWGSDAVDVLARILTYDGGLPQGAPTSPRISSLVNWELDARLTHIANRLGARYTRYADDLTFSFSDDNTDALRSLLGLVFHITGLSGYQLNSRKTRIWRRHHRQMVTGLVVNQGARLPRTTRKWLRAVEHRARTGGRPTLSESQLAGWRAFASMIDAQRNEDHSGG
jgi:hypothetical protein